MRNKLTLLLFALATATGGSVLANDIYRWVDADGNVHYEDRPQGDEAERLDIESRPTDPDRIRAFNQVRAESRSEAAEQQQAAAEEQQQAAAEARAAAEERVQKCDSARAALEVYLNNRRLYRRSENGDREYLTDEEIDQTREETRRQVDEYCN